MSQHFKTICKCGIVVAQCRCPSKDKTVRIMEECTHVPLPPENASERLYEAHKANIRRVLNRHGVLTRDGWSMELDDLVEDLAKLK